MTETAPAPPPPELISRRPAPSSRLVLFGGLAAAAVLGLVLAAALSGDRKPGAQSEAESDKGLAIAVQPAPKPAAIPIVKGDPLNALPEEAANLPANPPRPAAAPAPSPEVIPAATPPAARPAPRSRPSFDCDEASSRAEQMICTDDSLAAADRRMDRLYQQALDAGVPPRILRRQQRAFLDAREEAARHGPDAVADVYSERNAELEGMAQGY